MDGGQKANIPLTAPIDVKTSDMFVPVNNPTLQHNRQQYQGHYLPSSVRFEHDGWAVGNEVYTFDFDYKFIELDNIGLNIFAVLQDNIVYIYFLDKDNNQVADISYNTKNEILAYNNCDIDKSSFITGTVNDKQFTISFDVLNVNNVNIISDLEHNISNTNYTFTISLIDGSLDLSVKLSNIQYPTNLIDDTDTQLASFINYEKDKYTYEGDKVRLTIENNIASLIVGNITKQTQVQDNKVSFNTVLDQQVKFDIKLNLIKFFSVFNQCILQNTNSSIPGASNNKVNLVNFLCNTNAVYINKPKNIVIRLPIWHSIRIPINWNNIVNPSSSSGSGYVPMDFVYHDTINSANVKVNWTYTKGYYDEDSDKYIPDTTKYTFSTTWLENISATYEDSSLQGITTNTITQYFDKNIDNSYVYMYACIIGQVSSNLKIKNNIVLLDEVENNIILSEDNNTSYIPNVNDKFSIALSNISVSNNIVTCDLGLYAKDKSTVLYYTTLDDNKITTDKLPKILTSFSIEDMYNNQFDFKTYNIYPKSLNQVASLNNTLSLIADKIYTYVDDMYSVITDTDNIICSAIRDISFDKLTFNVDTPSVRINTQDNSVIGNQNITIKYDSIELYRYTYNLFRFNIDTHINNKQIEGYNSNIDISTDVEQGYLFDIATNSIIIILKDVPFKCSCNLFNMLSSLPYVLNVIKDNKIYIRVGGYYMYLDFTYNTIYLSKDNKSWQKYNKLFSDNIDIDYRFIAYVVCKPKGLLYSNNIDVLNISDNDITVSYNNKQDSFNIDDLLYNIVYNTMLYKYVDVNSGSLDRHLIAKATVANEFQLLKQDWDTTNNVENFWWVDNKHIIALTKSKLVLKHKLDELDDWNADKWEIIKEYDRSNYITSTVNNYLCSSVYNSGSAMFITSECNSNNILLNIYDILDNMNKFTLSIPVVKKEIGTKLNDKNNVINTYSTLSVDNVISTAEWSASRIDNRLIIGLHYDRNFNQWAIVIDLITNSFYIIQGYGFVGVDGSLTGGQLPSQVFDIDIGFNNTVYEINTLNTKDTEASSISDIYTIANKVVGTAEQQWYIFDTVKDIVSHITYSNGTFTPAILPITNNYSINYSSPSFNLSGVHNKDLNHETIGSLVKSIDWSQRLGDIASYPVFLFEPVVTICNYLQQTLGQAAYVHYNSSGVKQFVDVNKPPVRYEENIKNEDVTKIYAITQDEITFDKVSIRQEQSIKSPYDGVIYTLASAQSSLLSTVSNSIGRTLQVNNTQNQVSLSDFGKNFTQYFLQNINSLHVADMNVQSIYPKCTSEVTAIKSLDMFYSTSSNQQVYAGPGYVNHNFIAQCVAQSCTSVQSEIAQQKIIQILKELTTFIVEMATFAGIKGAEEMIKAGEALLSGSVLQAGIGTGLLSAGYLAYIPLSILQNKIATIKDILNSINPSGLSSHIITAQTKHNYEIESKHTYGNKSECFMWPCFNTGIQSIKDETVDVVIDKKKWLLDLNTDNSSDFKGVYNNAPAFSTNIKELNKLDKNIEYDIAMIKGKYDVRHLPEGMAYVIGADTFLPDIPFKNENIDSESPVFSTPCFQDYIINDKWKIGRTASMGMTTWISVGDTKVIDGDLSNCVIYNDFCGIASPYIAIEVKNYISKKYLRPYALTPNILALNNTGLNTIFERKAYHGFDGYGYRVINWLGQSGINKDYKTWLYQYLVNDRFKRSNKLPMNEYGGNFQSNPNVAITSDYNDKVYVLVTQPSTNKGIESGTVKEDKDDRRYAIPLFIEQVNTLPATVKTISSVTLDVFDGVTALTTRNRDLTSNFKVPESVDFSLGKSKYRYTQDFICAIDNTNDIGITVTNDVVPCLGLTFIGSTPYDAYFYNYNTKQYYVFSGGSSLSAVNTIERFRDIFYGKYDFINQEVVMPCVATFIRLDKYVHDDSNETDNVIVPRLKNNVFIGEIAPPVPTIFNTASGFKTLSIPCGTVYQGPNRCIINRFVLHDYMIEQIKNNYGKWIKVPREIYNPFRKYKDIYERVDKDVKAEVIGWTHNPFLFVTSPLGIDENVDCIFEWEITFAWPIEMDKLYGIDNYATVNITAETMTPGGKVVAERPTHIFLVKELFTRTGNYGYYSFRYQSKCGAGNRERLHIWSDSYICISSLTCEYKPLTQKRNEILTQQVDIYGKIEI